MLKGILTVGGWTLVSRILGFARDMLIAALIGTGPVADAFFVALKLPNLFRRLFGEGAFNAAFIPAFAGMLQTEGGPAARVFASQAFSVMAFWLGGLTLLGEIFMPQLMVVLAPGFSADPAKFFPDHVPLSDPDLPGRIGIRCTEWLGAVYRLISLLRAIQHHFDRLHDLDAPLRADGWTCVVLGRVTIRRCATGPVDGGGAARWDDLERTASAADPADAPAVAPHGARAGGRGRDPAEPDDRCGDRQPSTGWYGVNPLLR
jgi:hypothetical protein